jgi:hypothetical protein
MRRKYYMAEDLQADNEWTRVGDYLDRLAFENDRLEAELKLKKARRLMQQPEPTRTPDVRMEAKPQEKFDEVAETSRYEAQTATETTQGMHLSYDALRRDLGGLMSDLNDFKHSRASVESRLHS